MIVSASSRRRSSAGSPPPLPLPAGRQPGPMRLPTLQLCEPAALCIRGGAGRRRDKGGGSALALSKLGLALRSLAAADTSGRLQEPTQQLARPSGSGGRKSATRLAPWLLADAPWAITWRAVGVVTRGKRLIGRWPPCKRVRLSPALHALCRPRAMRNRAPMSAAKVPRERQAKRQAGQTGAGGFGRGVPRRAPAALRCAPLSSSSCCAGV